ncbi:hypothetical protein ACFL6O_05700 [candidate division KSB1 bacterium]
MYTKNDLGAKIICFLFIILVFSNPNTLNAYQITDGTPVLEVNVIEKEEFNSEVILDDPSYKIQLYEVSPYNGDLIVISGPEKQPGQAGGYWKNIGLYIYDMNGSMKKKFSEKNGKPYVLDQPASMEIAKNGDIYIFCYASKQIMVYSPEGVYKRYIRVMNPSSWAYMKFRILEEENILVNIPANGYFFTVLGYIGETVNMIGKTPELSEDEKINETYNVGIPFLVDNRYYLFNQFNLKLLTIDPENDFKEELPLDKILSVPGVRDRFTDPAKLKRLSAPYFIFDIVYDNGYFYMLMADGLFDTKDLTIIKTDKKIREFTKMILPMRGSSTGVFDAQLDILNNGSVILVKDKDKNRIVKFTLKN